ncbi:short-chain fatty acid transporter [Bacillus mycoides]|uniref:Short-chain fatty acid transporter n=1 Tax=Bacillus mycoides TaxID=1405 RepID=A0A1E8B539_BACMY|nr:short-chain fatty acid transporter [Bacillus mycoides]OFD76502.1 short-chain fatty acid transporter [Bacillus mycoides]OFD78002.1 short-chain fatty acid transporter [Bacillus mycoides]
MFRSFTNGCVALVQRFLPEPFILSCLLTVFVIFFGMFATHQTPVEMITHWGNGIWGLLTFSMQMALVLVTGSALANAPLIKKGLTKAAKLPKTNRPRYYRNFNCKFTRSIHKLGIWYCCLCFICKRSGKTVRRIRL